MRYAVLLILLGACSSYPDLGPGRVAGVEASPYPALVPLQTLTQSEDPFITPDMTASLSARLAALKARAARLRAMQN